MIEATIFIALDLGMVWHYVTLVNQYEILYPIVFSVFEVNEVQNSAKELSIGFYFLIKKC